MPGHVRFVGGIILFSCFTDALQDGKLVGAAFFAFSAIDAVGDLPHEFIPLAFEYALGVKAVERHLGVHDG